MNDLSKTAGFLSFLLCLFGTGWAQPSHTYPISAVPINQVTLTDNFWLPKIKTVQQTTLPFGFDKCYREGRMDNFLIAGGKLPGPVRGKMPFDDTDVYKLIEGASNSLISAPNPKLAAYLDSLIGIIAIGQERDGYLTTWHTIDPNHPPADWVKPGPRWQGEIMSHELYNAGHLYEAAATHFVATGKRNFLAIALKNADLLVNTFGPEPGKRKAPPGHQIVETGLIKLYTITKRADYANLARFFLDARGDDTTHKLYGQYSQDQEPVTQQNEAVGHAVRAVYMYAGMTDVGTMYGDRAYLKAVETIWANMAGKKMYLTGGIGSRHEGEAFGNDYELPNATAYNETCAAIGDVYWNQRLFLLTGDARYYDIIERTLYNGLIAGISLDGDHFFYPNPLASNGTDAFNFGSATRQPWFDCSCCPTNLVRFVPSMPNLIYATTTNNLFVNLFAANTARLTLGQTSLRVTQQTNYPWAGAVRLTIDPATSKRFALSIRIPGWARNQVLPTDLYQYVDKAPVAFSVAVNGKAVPVRLQNGYAVIDRTWTKGDVVTVNLPMSVRRVVADAQVTADSGQVALEYGPVVYCVEAVDNRNQVANLVLPDNAPLTVAYHAELLNGVNVITGTLPVGGNSLTMNAIPYYAWSNRGAGAMSVWLPRKQQ